MPSQVFPFIMRENIFARYYKKKAAGVFSNMRVMFEKNFLDEVDTMILIHLQKYVYLNAFLLRKLLYKQLDICTPDFCNSHLKKLEKYGFVVRFQFVYKDDKGKEHATPFVYNLSASARKLFPIKGDFSFNDNIMDIDCVLRRLSYNQFHIALEDQYNRELTYSSYIFDNKYDGLYKLQAAGKPVIFYVFSIRTTNEWEKKYRERLENFMAHINSSGMSYSCLIVICENEYHALMAERSRSGNKELSKLDIYYVSDHASVAETSILQNIISVHPEDNYSSYDIISIHVDGEVKLSVDKAKSGVSEK